MTFSKPILDAMEAAEEALSRLTQELKDAGQMDIASTAAGHWWTWRALRKEAEKSPREYTHVGTDGVKWRFDGGRPVSEIADQVMASALPVAAAEGVTAC